MLLAGAAPARGVPSSAGSAEEGPQDGRGWGRAWCAQRRAWCWVGPGSLGEAVLGTGERDGTRRALQAPNLPSATQALLRIKTNICVSAVCAGLSFLLEAKNRCLSVRGDSSRPARPGWARPGLGLRLQPSSDFAASCWGRIGTRKQSRAEAAASSYTGGEGRRAGPHPGGQRQGARGRTLTVSWRKCPPSRGLEGASQPEQAAQVRLGQPRPG